MIRINNLHKYYNKGKKSEQHVLDDVSLEFDRTGLVCILGESGSGKTTLLNTIGGLDTFSGGTITIEDTELNKYDPKKMEPIRNDRFAYIFQNYYLLQDYTVAYNVKLALNRYDMTEEEKDERVSYVLDMLGIGKYKKKLVSKLSGGQQQRVSIARALVKSPDVIMADEPTGNLDEENTIRTMSILKSISKECLVLLVTHERRIAKFFADRIIEVCDGKIVWDEKNEASDSYTRSDDSNIYLKEMQCHKLEDDMATFYMYHHDTDKLESTVPDKIKLSLAWKDGKLYIQNQMECDILLEGVENGVRMLDEERPKLDMDDVDQFSYDLPKLPSKGSANLSSKEIWKMALENIRLMGKKQAFVIVILLVTAVLLSVTMAKFVNTVSIDEASIVNTDSHYVKMNFTKVSSLRSQEEQWQIMEFVWEHMQDEKYGEIFVVPDVSLYLNGKGYTQITSLRQTVWNASFVSKKYLKEESLIHGEMPKKRNDVVMDIKVVEQLMKSDGVVSSLYNNVEDYLGEVLSVATSDVKINVVGISDTGEPSIYCGQNLLIGCHSKGYQIASLDELKAALEGEVDELTLEENQMLIDESYFKTVTGYSDFDKYIEDYGEMYETIGEDRENVYEIVGTCPDEMNVDYVLSEQGCENVRDVMIYRNKSCFLYTENAEELMEHYSKLGKEYARAFKLDLSIPYEDQIAEYKEMHSANLDAQNLITAVIMLISLIMVYFTIKSNAVSRSEELTVYRLLGISRGSILKAYMLEMVLMTCYTSLPAVLVTSAVIKFIGEIPSLELGMIFPWWSVLILLVIIYLIHIIISILPVYGILSKPPATLAVKE